MSQDPQQQLQWYYGQNGVQGGPVSLADMRQLVSNGQLRREDLVWREGMPNWAPAGTIHELFPTGGGYAAPQPGPYAAAPPQQAYPPTGAYPPGQPTHLGYAYDVDGARLQSKAQTSMVLGICSIVIGFCCCGPVGIGLAIAAIVMGKNASGAPNPGPARTGLICGIVGLVLSILGMILNVVYFSMRSGGGGGGMGNNPFQF